jgi:hypothetical protein
MFKMASGRNALKSDNKVLTDLIIAPHTVWRDVEGELAILDGRDQSYHELNVSAAAIWRAIAAGDSLDVIAEQLAARYGIARATMAAEVATFVDHALTIGLLQTREPVR